MLRNTVLLLLVLIGSADAVVPATEVEDRVDPHQAVRLDWSGIASRSNQLRTSNRDGVVSIWTEGQDPYFHFELPRLGKRNRDWILEFEYFCPQGIQGLQWRSGRSLHKPTAVSLPAISVAEGWTTYTLNLSQIAPDAVGTDAAVPARIDLGAVAGVRLQIRNVLIRPMSPEELAIRETAALLTSRKEQLAARIEQYRSDDWPATIDSVDYDGSQVHLSGRFVSADSHDRPFLIARDPASVSADAPTIQELHQKWPVTIDDEGRSFRASIPSVATSPWLAAGSRFQLFARSEESADAANPISPATYCRPRALATTTPVKPLRAAKGLTCITSRFSPDQLSELGLQHASVNIAINGLVSDSEKDGWKATEIHGRTWWVDERRLGALDRDVRTMTDAGIVGAGILLIPTSKQSPSSIAHPESTTAGTYAMPNLTDRRSVAIYAATLQMLGQRYGGSHPQHGRLDHWIVHNEVDYGWQWTNMGEQPMEVFMDHYVRSMRLVDSAVRQHNPHARVFISLTHRWNTTDNRHWKTYAPKRMLEWLIREGQLEGEFPWGVAFHPYPQSLWKSDTWNDKRVSDEFDTELITIKNLQVLDRFMHLPRCRTKEGHVRPVICSEQGFHADETNTDQLRIQAAALLYTWEKLRQCPSILAFDYHRPSDHPREGGLHLGLRGLPSKSDRLGEPKPAWDVYSAIGTEREAEMVERYRSLWEYDAPR